MYHDPAVTRCAMPAYLCPAASAPTKTTAPTATATTATVAARPPTLSMRSRPGSKPWTPSALDLVTDLDSELEGLCAPSVTRARSGLLSAADAAGLTTGSLLEGSSLADLPRDEMRMLIRNTFTSRVSWALFTEPWVASVSALLSRLIGGRRGAVLEVCAGSGVLSSVMAARGFEWVATDRTPGPGSAAEARGALDSLLSFGERGPAAVFWSWWSRNDAGAADEERLVAEHCYSRGIPVVFVGEPRGGITGSSLLWDGPWKITAAQDLLDVDAPPFADVACWEGFEDRTWVLV